MKRAIFFFRNYKYDLLTSFFTLVLYYLSFRFSDDPNIILFSSVIITFVSLSIILFIRLKDKDFYFIPLTKRQDKDDWIGRGQFEYRRTNDSYLITDSEPGFIFSKTLNWNDYKFEFDFKILNSCLGAIVRAVNLSDYVMMQINLNGIRPHIRINGGWRPWEAEETGLVFEKPLSPDIWYSGLITCEKDLINIQIKNNNNVVLQRSWTISHERLGFPFPQRENDPQPLSIHFPINLDYGTVGFRNSGNEKALIKNVLIEKI